jgi:hypothetical protein
LTLTRAMPAAELVDWLVSDALKLLSCRHATTSIAPCGGPLA